jgi:hypothetical protein
VRRQYRKKNLVSHLLFKAFLLILIAASMTFIQIDAVTSDRLLIALFGGCLIGVEWDFASEVDLSQME